ncbi:MAG: hypothetical protein O3A36_00625 [bacterium]|nr:hypothetical protein [bacterium]
MSLRIAIIPPKQVIDKITDALLPYSASLSFQSNDNTWHIPLSTLQHMPSLTPIRHSFHQTLRILSIGEGQDQMSLSVRIQQSPSLTALIASLPNKSTLCVPEILLGSFEQVPAFGILDTPLTITFSVRELAVIQIDPYEIIGTIPITP